MAAARRALDVLTSRNVIEATPERRRRALVANRKLIVEIVGDSRSVDRAFKRSDKT